MSRPPVGVAAAIVATRRPFARSVRSTEGAASRTTRPLIQVVQAQPTSSLQRRSILREACTDPDSLRAVARRRELDIYRSYKTELDPTKEQRELLGRHCGARRFAYNWGLERKIEEYKATCRTPSAIDLHRELNRRKKQDLGWLYEVSKCAPQEALRDLDSAFENFFRSLRSGDRRMRYPRFQRRKRGLGSFRLTNRIVVLERSIRLPRLGHVRLKERGYLPVGAHVLSATVSERAGRWFVSVRVKEQRDRVTNGGPIVGVDMGINALVTVSDGTTFTGPKARSRFQRRLRKLQRSAARQRNGGRNRAKTYARISSLHLRIRNARLDAIHKATTRLTKTKSVIVVEDLAVANLMHGSLAGHLGDAALRETRRQLEYKALLHGSQIVVANRFFPSSKLCSACGHLKKELALSVRVYVCDVCGASLDRDLNAARNLMLVAARSAETQNACGAEGSGWHLPVKLSALKQEPGVVQS